MCGVDDCAKRVAAVCCRYPARLYASLGVDLWMLKLHSSLAVLGGTARTFTGHVSTAHVQWLRPPVDSLQHVQLAFC